jgi:hypothetical protein
LLVAVRGLHRRPRVQAMRTRLRWFAGLRNPYTRRASSLASRFRLSQAAFVTPVGTAQMISYSHRDAVLTRDCNSGMSSFCAYQS